MATEVMNRYILTCDGCGARHGARDGSPSAMEARAAAYVDGWRYPNHVRADGTQGATSSDVCPACLPTWKPQARTARHRYMPQAEAQALRAPEMQRDT